MEPSALLMIFRISFALPGVLSLLGLTAGLRAVDSPSAAAGDRHGLVCVSRNRPLRPGRATEMPRERSRVQTLSLGTRAGERGGWAFGFFLAELWPCLGVAEEVEPGSVSGNFFVEVGGVAGDGFAGE